MPSIPFNRPRPRCRAVNHTIKLANDWSLLGAYCNMASILDGTSAAYALGLLAATGSLAWLLSRKPYVHTIGGRESPPGPKRKFLIGNAKNFPVSGWMDAFIELRKTYGMHICWNVGFLTNIVEYRRYSLLSSPRPPNIGSQLV